MNAALLLLSLSLTVSAEVPEKQNIDALLLSTDTLPAFERASAIRKYLASVIDLGTPAMKTSADSNLDVFDYMTLSRSDSLTSLCGLTSRMLADLYQYAGYGAFTYKFGLERWKASHEFTLINIDGAYYVQDAFYNMTTLDTSGAPKEFYAMMSDLNRRDLSNIVIAEDTLLTQFWFDTPAAADSTLGAATEWRHLHVKSLTPINGRWCAQVQRSYSILTSAMMPSLRTQFTAFGLPYDYLYLILIGK